MSSQPTATYQTPSCFVCGRISYIELPAATAAALSATRPHRHRCRRCLDRSVSS